MQLIALTGLSAVAKQRASLHLLTHFGTQGWRVALLDNNDLPLGTAYSFQTIRLARGCVCCSLARQLITTIGRIDAERIILPVSMQADPAALRQVLDSLGVPAYILNWNVSNLPIPYLKERLAAFADLNVVSLEELDASLRL
jgi:hypothetical protein